jgi:hypothetical protein
MTGMGNHFMDMGLDDETKDFAFRMRNRLHAKEKTYEEHIVTKFLVVLEKLQAHLEKLESEISVAKETAPEAGGGLFLRPKEFCGILEQNYAAQQREVQELAEIFTMEVEHDEEADGG